MNIVKIGRLLAIAIALLATPVFIFPITAQAAVYGFNLGPPNTSLNPSTGDTIRVTGGGTFDTTLGTVLANGAYSVRNAAGAVTERGTWAATAFGDFEALGGLTPGVQGGVLHITVTLFPNGGAPRTNVPVTVICPFEESEGVFDEDDDGTIVGNFAVPTGGITVFHLIQP
jgi:hypothetical protein